MPALRADMSSVTDPNDQIRTALLDVLGQVFGVEPSAIDPQAQFLEMGVDSLALLRLSQIVQDGFGVKIPFRKMLEEVSTIDALTGYIAQELSSDSGNESATPRTADYLLNLRQWAVEQTDDLESATPAPPHNHRQTEETLNVSSGAESAAPTSPSDYPPGLISEALTPDEAALADGAALERIFAQQIQIMTQQMAQQTQVMSAQLDLLRRYGRVTASTSAATTAPSEKAEAPLAKAPKAPAVATDIPARPTAAAHNAKPGGKVEAEVFVPYKPIRVEKGNRLTERQRQHLESLVERITRKTQGSKRLTQTYRPYLADNRSSAGFHHLWKEMCYPLVVERGQGARVYDVDGNEYIDLTMGFGALMFGHSPDFLVKAMQEAVTNGVRLGGQSDIVGQTAKLICELTGVERVAFCNSGTEAVMGALRLARTVTGRSNIAIFEGSYHGTFDGVMVRPGGRKADGRIEALPMAPGVPRHMIENVLLLGYDDDEALAAIEAHARDLAAVIIEPPRSRRPDVQPREFLHKLREITRRAGIALIFDEVVTGFRFHPGGVQALFEVQADLVAYGKAIGNGVPIGVVAGKAAFMDAVDGGMWNYGDDSYPSAETTFFAGTYFKNPLVVAAVRSILNHIKETGPQLYEDLNARAHRLGNALKEYFERESVPIQVLQVGSLFRFQLPPRQSLLDLFYYHLLEKGVYICETRNCFFSTAHTDQDVDHILRAVKETIEEMREGGFFPDRTSSGPGRNSSMQDTPGGPPPLAIPASSFGVAAAAALAPATERPQVAASSLPLTEAQKQLWFLAQLGEEASVAYNLSLTLELRGAFHYEHMRRCFQAVVDNHEALRITFSPDGERQYVNPVVPVELSLIDVSTLQQPEQRESAGRRRVAAFAKQPFDLINGPLIRGCVVKLASDFHLLAVATHHTVTDGGSFGVLLRELSQRYTAACRDEQPVISPPFQFSQFVQWEAGHLAGDKLHQMEQYWLGQFADPSPPLDLPTDRQRPALQSYAGARESFSLGPELSARLLQFSARQGSTPFMLLLAAVNLLLHRLSGQDDVVVGIPVAGQTSFGGPLIGYCLNVLPIRSRIGEAMSFNEYLDSAKKALLDAYEHQAYPFNLLVKKLKIPRDPSRAPLITVMFNLDRVTSQPQFEGLQVNLTQNTTDTAQFDLDINVKQTKDDFHFDCDYSASLFDRATIQRWLSHLENLLAEIVSRPAEQPGKLRLLNEAERQQILFDWNSTSAPYPKQTSLARLFEEQVARTPDNVAVSCADRRLTYAELNRRANRLARILLRTGVGPEVVVALLAERDIEMLIAILAVFKAGGAYLPLDPGHPPQRLAQLLEQGKVGLALTTREFEDRLENAASRFSQTARPTILILEESIKEAQSEENLPLRAEAENLAYVIFTSGSTGTPKGAMVVQQGMVNHLYAKISDLRLEAGDVVAQTASQCFDISVWQFLSALLVGGEVCILPDEVAHDSRRMMKEVERRGVTILEVVPSLLQEVLSDAEVDEAWRMGQGELRWLLVTGEAVAPEMCRRWLGCYPGAPIMNAYGPTECSDDVTHYVINQEIPADLWNVPIGRPIANTWLFILDEYCEPLPVGVRGELYVGGDGVGRGYLERADMTAERFVPNPFGGRSGERLYRTGDVARYLSDGQIEFLGRLDHQVKVRGYRIELGEIEHALSRHAGVRHAVAVVREDAPGEKRIVAYYVGGGGEVGTDNGEAPGSDELRGYLQGQLPDYMIPGAFVLLTEFPLTSTGKIDRKALPVPEGAWVSRVEYEAPRTELEAILAEVWQEALRVELVGVRDNFFELGGDSILSMRVVGRARARGVELSPAELFRHQSVAELAAAIQARQSQEIPLQDTAPRSLIGASLASLDEPTLTRLKEQYRQIVDVYPLSPTQQGMLFNHLYNPDSAAYFEQISWRLEGALNVDALRRAWLKVIERHPVLRTAFVWEDLEDPLQVVCGEIEFEMALQDWSGMTEKERETSLEDYLRDDRERGFDLRRVPLRLALIKVDDAAHQLVWSYHHILLDGWAVMLVLKELFALYDAYSQGEELELEPSRPFSEYIRWLQQQDLSNAEAFWRSALAGVTAPTPLGVDRVRGAGAGKEEFKSEQSYLSATATTALQNLARRHRLTMSTLAQGAWALLLSRYSGQDDVVFGTVVAGRPPELEGAETMVGLFINTLPTRAQLEPEAGVVEWLQGLQSRQAEARRYEHSPLAQVQGWSDVGRGTPLFESIIAFENYPVSAVPPQGQSSKFKISNVEVVERVNYPLFVVVGPGQRLFLSIYYEAGRFDAETVERMLSRLQALLESIAERPNQRLDDLSLLSPAEERQLVSEWNATDAAYPRGLTVAQLFEQQVSRTPEAVAAVYEGRRVTYRELNRRANQLAHYLRKRGVGPEALVGLCVERSLEMVVGLLGILKAGGAYLPLDQAYPVDRLAYMLRDAQVKVLVTQRNFSESLPDEGSTEWVFLDADSSQIGAEQTGDLAPLATDENLAYVIYTSGSTGAPKGVQLPHRALVNFLHAMRSQLEFRAEDYLSAVTSISFDIAGLEIFLPLVTGATVEIISREIAADGERLAERLNVTGASVMQATPASWEMLLEAGWGNDSGVKSLCGGEALPRGLATKLLDGAAPVWNLYGPTETTIWSTAQEVRDRTGTISIGRPIANTKIYITDKTLRPAPAGVPGELFIGGDGVGRGYLERADTTAERFVPNPFGDRSGERLYRTGDVARYLSDGQIEFLGRLDHQVKVRGYRIELGEIEHALSRHAGVRHAVAVVREDTPGEKRIVAYYVGGGGEVGTDNGEAPGSDELRGYLQGQLPDYMIPGAFVLLTEFPLTPSGKIDRKALPVPEGARVSRVEYEAPRTELEAILAEVWQEALRVELVGVRDNFFELGGDSILSMRVVGRARARGVELSPAELFRHQSIAELSAAIQARQSPHPTHLSGTVPLTPAQRWFFGLNQPAPHHFNQAVMLELSSKIKPAILAQVVEELVARHDALRVRFNNEGGRWRQVIVGPERVSAFTTQDLSAIPVAGQVEAIEALAEEIQASLNLGEGPLFRAVYIKLGARQSNRLLLVAHHLAVDLSSWRILLGEFQGAYQQLSREKPLMAPPPSASFGRWAQKLSEWADSDESLSEANYWLDQSRAAAAPLPIDFDGGLNVESSVGALITTLSEKDSRALLYEATKAFRAAPNEVLLTALALAGTRWSGQDKFLVDIEGHGREDLFPDIDLSRTVGWFTAIYPALLDLSEAGTALEALKQVKKQVRATPRGGIGYGALKYLSHRDDIVAGLQAQPQAEVSFNYIGPTATAKQTKGSIRLAKESLGHLVSEHNSRPYRLMVSGQVENQRLIVHWNYSKNVHREETIRELAGYFKEALQDLLAGCEQKAEGLYTPSDFPNANLNQNELDEFLSTLA